MSPKRQLLRADGTSQDLYGPKTIEEIRALIGADTLGVVTLHHLGLPLQVMLVDDVGFSLKKPRNEAATALYWKNCLPNTTHPICGDVVLAPDYDFAQERSR